MIAIGDRLPEMELIIVTGEGRDKTTTSELFGGKQTALFAVPGAFTKGCTETHLPSFLDNIDKFVAKGVDQIVCLAVNDASVLEAWAKSTGSHGKITFLADGSGHLTHKMGLEADMSKGGMGIRSRRYSMLIDDGVIKHFNLEKTPAVEISDGGTLLGLM
ncbi:MAG: peroxiredoxin [Flavobacteriaceae bacterium]